MTPCDAAVVRSGDTELLLTSKRVLGAGLKGFKALGIEPEDKQYLVLKHSYGHEGAGSRTVTNVAGSYLLDYKTLPFLRIKRPMWPWDNQPFDHLDTAKKS